MLTVTTILQPDAVKVTSYQCQKCGCTLGAHISGASAVTSCFHFREAIHADETRDRYTARGVAQGTQANATIRSCRSEGLDDEFDAAWSNLNVEKRSNWDSPIMAVMTSVRSGSMERNPAVWNRREVRELKSLCQYISGQWLLVRFLQWISAQISGRTLTGSVIGDEIKGDFLALVEAIHSCTLNGADVNEHILASVGRLNEAKSLLAVEPLYDPLHH
jgi:hypothetical protein